MNKKCVLLFMCSIMLASCSGNRPVNLGVSEGKLLPCPDSPNCVSSQSHDTDHYIDPLQYKGTLTEAREQLLGIITSMKRVSIVTEQEDYIYTEFTSALFRFVDDVEFYFDDDTLTIHLRSASRVGYSDLGANRKRLERIHRAFSEEQS